jgi:hypothetical protein
VNTNSPELQVRIAGQAVTRPAIEAWERKRAAAALRVLSRKFGPAPVADAANGGMVALRATIARAKIDAGRDRIRGALRRECAIAGATTSVLNALSGGRRTQCVTEIWLPACSASRFSKGLDDLMLRDTDRNHGANLLASPDHWLLEARNGVLEVIEVVGAGPFASRFFMRFDDPSGLRTDPSSGFTHHSMGTARSASGAVVGGVRHQFRDQDGGTFARLMVEFPRTAPAALVRQHQMHLACEFSSWMRHICR